MSGNTHTGEEDRHTVKTRTLIVDDSEIAAKMIESLLTREGRVDIVGVARNGQEGVELAEALAPDLVIMDLNMPVMDGLEATRRIKAAESHPCVIMVTLDDSPGVRVLAQEAGVDGLCSKIAISQQLMAEISACQEKKKQTGP